MNKKRCSWCNINNDLYIKYHDEEWGKITNDDNNLFELLLLESFQAGLSWECILNKRENFRKAFDNFNYHKIANYDENKISELCSNKDIIRNKLKIKSAVKNSKIFIDIQKEFGSFNKYLLTFYKGNITYESDKTTSKLSDDISKDLKRRGMNFVGSTIIYSYLQAVGIINSHFEYCYLYNKDRGVV